MAEPGQERSGPRYRAFITAPKPTLTTARQHVTLTAMLTVAMALAVFALPSIGVLSRFIIDDLGMSRTEIGWVAAATALTSALLGPPVGRLTDRFGGKRGLLVLLAFSAAGLASLGLAPGYGFLVAAAVVAGASQAGANPATNILIADLVEPGRRGLVTGIKQSGVQVGIFVGGLLLPAGALAFGWRATLLVAAAFPIAALAVAAAVVPDTRHVETGPGPRVRHPVPPAVRWLAAYGFFMGLGGGAVGTYLPLFAQESLGYHVTTAGFAVATAGFTAIVFRVGWGHFTERSGRFAAVLCTMALLAVAAMAVLWLSGTGIRWLLWPAAVLLGTSNGSWNAAAMLTVISLTAGRAPGRASGTVMAGFGTGLALGPPIFGFSVDTSGGYRIGIAVVLAWFAVAAVITRLWARAEQRR